MELVGTVCDCLGLFGTGWDWACLGLLGTGWEWLAGTVCDWLGRTKDIMNSSFRHRQNAESSFRHRMQSRFRQRQNAEQFETQTECRAA